MESLVKGLQTNWKWKKRIRSMLMLQLELWWLDSMVELDSCKFDYTKEGEMKDKLVSRLNAMRQTSHWMWHNGSLCRVSEMNLRF